MMNDLRLAGQVVSCPHCRQPLTLPVAPASPLPAAAAPDPLDFDSPTGELPADPVEQQIEHVRATVHSLGLSPEGQTLMDSALDRQRKAAASPKSPHTITLWVTFWSITAAVIVGIFGWDQGRPNPLSAAFRCSVLAMIFGGGTWVALWKVYGGEYAMRRWRIRERSRRQRVEQKHSSCPSCEAIDEGELVSRKRVETGEIEYVTLHKPMPVTDSLGNVTHHIHVPVQEPYRKAVLRVTYRCRHCSHTWTHDEAQLPFL